MGLAGFIYLGGAVGFEMIESYLEFQNLRILFLLSMLNMGWPPLNTAVSNDECYRTARCVMDDSPLPRFSALVVVDSRIFGHGFSDQYNQHQIQSPGAMTTAWTM